VQAQRPVIVEEVRDEANTVRAVRAENGSLVIFIGPRASNSGLPSPPGFPLSVHRSDESDRDYIATGYAVSRICSWPPKKYLPPVDAPKNAGQTYAKRAFRAAKAPFYDLRPSLEYLLNI